MVGDELGGADGAVVDGVAVEGAAVGVHDDGLAGQAAVERQADDRLEHVALVVGLAAVGVVDSTRPIPATCIQEMPQPGVPPPERSAFWYAAKLMPGMPSGPSGSGTGMGAGAAAAGSGIATGAGVSAAG